MREKTKDVRSFALKTTTLDTLREVAEESRIAGGMSAIVQDALAVWLGRYKADPKDWLNARGIAHSKPPQDDI